MTDPEQSKRQGPGRPRRSDVEEADPRATLDLLREVSFAALSFEMVAERARVSKPTMYRRWSSKAALVADVIARSSPPYPPLDDAEDLHDWLHACFVGTYRSTRDTGV